MENYYNLWMAFELLNKKKRKDPKALSESEWKRWRELRHEIENVLFEKGPRQIAEDSREYVRVPVSLTVKYWSREELKDRYIPVLGEGGVFISTVDPLPVGSEMDLDILLMRSNLTLTIKGKVVWANAKDEDPAQRGMGIKFINLSYDQKRLIYGLVDDVLRQSLLERRRFARIQATLQVQFIYAEGFFELDTADVSLGGLFIATDHLVPIGEKVRLVLHVPGGKPALNATGVVVRVVEEGSEAQPAGLGIRFNGLDNESKTAIQRFLAAQIEQEHSQEGERRKSPRVERMVKLRFRTVGTAGSSMAQDISSNGVFIHTHEPPPIGTEILVSLVHPVTLARLELVGTVVRVVEAAPTDPPKIPGIGVAFEKLNAERKAYLQQFLKEFLLQETPPDSDPGATCDPPVSPDQGLS